MKMLLTETFESRPLLPLLRPEFRALVPPAEDRAAWSAILPEHRQEILSLVDRYASQPYPMRTASGFLAFVRSGSRAADEQPYFFRRRKLCAAALGYCALGDGPEDAERRAACLDAVVDGVWCVCEESSWVISAHNVNPIPGAPSSADYPLPDTARPYVDLFSAQTGMILSFVVSMMGEALSSVSREILPRVRREIDSRILTPFMTTDEFWWMGFRRRDLNNWTPWIVSNVMLCAVQSPLPEETLAALLTRGCAMLDRWLACVPEDGGCDEGAGYWNMAGGAFLDCLDLLSRLTGGAVSFWDHPKVRNIMLFPLRAEIGNGWFLNFADCDARPFISGERIRTAGERLGIPALAAMGRRLGGTLEDQLADVPHLSRVLSLLFHAAPSASPAEAEPADTPDAPSESSCWLPDLQAGQFRRGALTLCCKGGHNGENHNHNDVGSFMLYIDQEPAVVDAGNMTYTAKTFSSERYTLWNTRSAFHNLPLIGGLEQQPGEKYRATEVNPGESGVAMNLEEAWPAEAGLRSFRRALSLSDCGLILKDDIQLEAEKEVAWVFLLRHRPVPESGALAAGQLRMTFPSSLAFSTEEIPVTDPRMARNFPGSLWRVVLTAPAAKAHAAEFRFSAQ